MADERTCKSANGRQAAELGQDLGREASGKQARQDAGSDAEDAQHVAHARRRLRGEARDGANAEDGAGQVSRLHQAGGASGSRSDEATAK